MKHIPSAAIIEIFVDIDMVLHAQHEICIRFNVYYISLKGPCRVSPVHFV